MLGTLLFSEVGPKSFRILQKTSGRERSRFVAPLPVRVTFPEIHEDASKEIREGHEVRSSLRQWADSLKLFCDRWLTHLLLCPRLFWFSAAAN